MTFDIVLYKRGTEAWLDGRPYTIDHVSIRNYDLYIYLTDREESFRPEQLSVKPTRITMGK